MIYRREVFLEEDHKPGSQFPLKEVEQLTNLDGSQKRFLGHVSLGLQTPMGMSTLPLNFEIQAATIEEAFGKFEERAQTEIVAAKAELQAELSEMRRQQQSRIITPGELPPTDLGKLKF